MRDVTTKMDTFMLLRKSNFVPELIFNQHPEHDLDRKHRYFELDHQLKWRLTQNHNSNQDTCYICEQE